MVIFISRNERLDLKMVIFSVQSHIQSYFNVLVQRFLENEDWGFIIQCISTFSFFWKLSVTYPFAEDLNVIPIVLIYKNAILTSFPNDSERLWWPNVWTKIFSRVFAKLFFEFGITAFYQFFYKNRWKQLLCGRFRKFIPEKIVYETFFLSKISICESLAKNKKRETRY